MKPQIALSLPLDHYEAIRKEEVIERQQELIKGDYSPLRMDNFEEFLRELVEDEQLTKTMFAHVLNHSQQSEPHFMNLALLGEVLVDGLHQYWEKRATIQADGEIPSAIETKGDAEGYR